MRIDCRRVDNSMHLQEREDLDSQPIEAADLEARAIKRVALSAFLVSLLLAALKGWLAHVSRSLVLMADSLDSPTDSLASLMICVGLQLATSGHRQHVSGGPSHWNYGLDCCGRP